MNGCESESRSRLSNVHPCGLRLDHSTTSHTYRPRLHDPYRPHPADRHNDQLAVRDAALGRPLQRQTTSMGPFGGTPGLPMSPLPPLRNPPVSLPNPDTSYSPNPDTTSLSVLERATRRVDRVPPRIAPARAREGGSAAEARHCTSSPSSPGPAVTG